MLDLSLHPMPSLLIDNTNPAGVTLPAGSNVDPASVTLSAGSVVTLMQDSSAAFLTTPGCFTDNGKMVLTQPSPGGGPVTAVVKVAGTLALGGKPEFAASDGRGTVYVNIENKNEVVAFDSKKLTVKGRWPVDPGEEPAGMAMDREHRRLFIGCGNKKMIVMDADSGKVIDALPIGDECDATAYDPATQLAFSSNGDGTLTIVKNSGGKWDTVDTVTTERGARTMTVDPRTHRVYLLAAEYGAPQAGDKKGRPSVLPDSFHVLVVGK